MKGSSGDPQELDGDYFKIPSFEMDDEQGYPHDSGNLWKPHYENLRENLGTSPKFDE